MERKRVFGGWVCTLSVEEIEYALDDWVLSDHLRKWQRQPDGTAFLRVVPWNLGSWETMELFIEGFGEGMLETVNVEAVKGVEIVRRIY